jgi:hypothetical protein
MSDETKNIDLEMDDHDDLFAGMQTVDGSKPQELTNADKIKPTPAASVTPAVSKTPATPVRPANWVDPREIEKRKREKLKQEQEKKKKKMLLAKIFVGGVILIAIIVFIIILSTAKEKKEELALLNKIRELETVKITEVIGKAKIYNKAGISVNYEEEKILRENSKIEVDPSDDKNRVILDFTNNSKIFIHPGTTVVIDSVKYDPETKNVAYVISVKKGITTVQIPEFEKVLFTVETPHFTVNNPILKYSKFKVQEGKKTNNNDFLGKYCFMAVRNGKVEVFNKETKKTLIINEYFKYEADSNNYFSAKPESFNPLSMSWN